MSNRLTKGLARIGKLQVTNGITVSSGPLTVSGGINLGNGGNSTPLTLASVGLCIARISVASLTGGEKDTGFALPANSIVRDVYLHIKTGESTAGVKTMSVGLLSTQPTGMTAAFLLGVSTASALNVGLVRGSHVAGSVTAGSGFQEGSAASGRFAKPYVVGATASSTAVNISYTPATVHTELVADILVEYEIVAL